MSTFSFTGNEPYSSTISGGRYIKVVFLSKISNLSLLLSFVSFSGIKVSLEAEPKSHNLKLLPKRNTFSIFTSRCAIGGFNECIPSNPFAIFFIIFNAVFSGILSSELFI